MRPAAARSLSWRQHPDHHIAGAQLLHSPINDGDLKTISSAVSYIDRVMQDSIPTLPTGTCIFSGVATQMPLNINVRELEEHRQPKSQTRKFSVMVPEAGAAPPLAQPSRLRRTSPGTSTATTG